MTGRTWGYAGQVGEWSGTLHIPLPHRRPPLAATRWVLGQVVRAFLHPLHQPRTMEVSWAEYDEHGRDAGFHELEECAAGTWDAAAASLALLGTGSGHAVAPSCLFVTMDTAVRGDDGVVWSPSSAELQISIPPPYGAPAEAHVTYTTYIDVWLSTTYGEGYVPRRNPAAARDRSCLEAGLRAFAALAGAPLRPGTSQLYPDALTETGFRDLDALPPRAVP